MITAVKTTKNVYISWFLGEAGVGSWNKIHDYIRREITRFRRIFNTIADVRKYGFLTYGSLSSRISVLVFRLTCFAVRCERRWLQELEPIGREV